jgi:ribosomal protein L12E/L44/L45/RPP1/RPP2
LQWFFTVFKHLDAEFTRLTQVKISEEETLILLSEEVIIMYNCFHAIQRKHMDFTVNGLRVEYMVWCIWIAMQVHMVMDEFTQDGMKYNLALSAAFIRFLTKVTGGNAAVDVAGSVTLLEAKLKNLDSALKKVKKEAAAASACANNGKQQHGQRQREDHQALSVKHDPQEVSNTPLGGRPRWWALHLRCALLCFLARWLCGCVPTLAWELDFHVGS